MVKKSHYSLSSRTYNIFFILILVIACSLIILSLKNIIFASGADEGYYLSYAEYINVRGITGFYDLFRGYLENQQHWVFPNPLRIGFIVLAAFFVKIFGNNFISLTYLSLVSYCLFLITCFYFARKYFDEKIALLFAILLAFSPLNMAMARRALMESTYNLFSVFSIWLFLDLLKERRPLKYSLFIFVYSFTILVKETGILLSLCFIAYLLAYKFIFKNKVYLKDLLSVTLIPFSAVGFIYIVSGGGLSNIIDTVNIILSASKSNQYAIIFGSGPWFRYLIDYMLLSPWVVILSIGYMLYYFAKKEHDEISLYFVVLFILTFFTLDLFTKNIRYVMILDMPLRLFTVLMLKRIFEIRFPKHAYILSIIFVIMISISDYANFYSLFVKEGIYDPVSFPLLRARHLIPYK